MGIVELYQAETECTQNIVVLARLSKIQSIAKVRLLTIFYI